MIACLLITVVTAFPNAAAAAERVDYSRDGHHWVPALHEPLFTGTARLVPGGAVRDGFWVRNTSHQDVHVVLRDNGTTDTVAATVPPSRGFQLSVEAGTASSTWSVGDLTGCEVLAARTLVPGQTVRFAIEVSLPVVAENATEDRRVVPDLAVESGPGPVPEGLATCAASGGDDGDDVGPAGPASDPTDGSVDLPATGTTVEAWWLAAGFLAVAAGGFLLRRHGVEQDESTSHVP